MNEPKPIGEVVDEAMAAILGAAGNEFYAELVRQTRENRERIERDVRSKFQDVFAAVFGELTGLHADPRSLDLAARAEAHRRVRAEIGRRVSDEERTFRARVDRLYLWSQAALEANRDEPGAAPGNDGG